MTQPSNRDLEVMLARIEERQIFAASQLHEMSIKQKEHEEKDDKRFENLNRYAAAIAIIASVFGGTITYVWKRFLDSI